MALALAAGARGQGLPAAPSPPAVGQPYAGILRKAAASLEAGGLVGAESNGGSTAFLETGRPLAQGDVPPEKIIFEIGSITKVFTALLLAQAVVEHRVALDDPIGLHLPPGLALDPGTFAITLEQLATHTSGLPRLPPNGRYSRTLNVGEPLADYGTRDLYAFLHYYRPERPAPQPPLYSNLGFGLLGHLLERIYGQPYAELIAERIAGPLGLPDTTVELNDEQRTRFAEPHSGRFAVPAVHLEVLAGLGALHSTAADLSRFASVLMSPGDDPLRAAWELASRPRLDFPAMGGRIGLGILILSRNGETVYWHNGATQGSRAYLEWTPRFRHAVAVLWNGDSTEADVLVGSLQPTRAAIPAAAPVPGRRPPRATMPLSAEKLAEYAGRYLLGPQEEFEVAARAGRLFAKFTGQPALEVFCDRPDHFIYATVDDEIDFERGRDGAVTALVVRQNGIAQRAPRER